MKEQKGFVLITTIFALALISVLGVGIIGVTTSNLNMVKIDSRSQSAYYVAEAGANHMVDEINMKVQENSDKYQTSIDFFQYIENHFTNEIKVFDSFERNNQEQPMAFITVSRTDANVDEDARDYKIESVGKIGSSERTVSLVVTLTWENVQQTGNMDAISIYGPKFTFTGSVINGEENTIVSGGLMTHDLNEGTKMDVTNLYFGGPVTMDGGSASLGNKSSSGSIYIDGNLHLTSGTRNIYGDVHVNGDATLKDAMLFGDIYVNGNLKFIENGPTPHKKIFYTGTIDAPSYYYDENSFYQQKILSKCIKVDSVPSFTIPSFDIKLKDSSWYIQNGYIVRNSVTEDVIPDNAKFLVGDYYSSHYTSPNGNIVIISKKDIDISGWRNITGVLIAPNGEVKLNIGSFTGVIISKEGLTATGGGWDINLRRLSDFFTESAIPIDIYADNGSSTGEEKNVRTKVEIKIPIREK